MQLQSKQRDWFFSVNVARLKANAKKNQNAAKGKPYYPAVGFLPKLLAFSFASLR